MAGTSNQLHDVMGIHRHWVQVGAYANSSDDGYQDMLMVAPWACKIKSVRAYFQGTASVTGGTTGNYFTLKAIQGTTAFGTSALTGTIAYATGLSIYSGAQSVGSGTAVYLQYGTAGGSAALNCPQMLVEVQYEGA